MDKLIEWIEYAKQENATELLIVPQAPMRVRAGKELIDASEQRLNPSDTRQLLMAVLNEAQRQTLETQNHVKGVAQLSNIQFRYSIDRSLNGLAGSLTWLDQGSLDNSKWEFHPGLVEAMTKAHGLVLVAGAQSSGKTAALHSLIWKYACTQNKSIALFSDFSDWQLPQGPSSYTYFSAESLKAQPDLAQYADMIVLDSRDLTLAATALQWAEAGKLVIVSVMAADWMRGLEKFADGLQTDASITAAQAWRRLSQSVYACLGLKLVKASANKDLIGLYELYLADMETAPLMLNKDFAGLQECLQTQGEKNGMRTMNQSIFQALLNRKIDVRTGFDASPDPTRLDEVLKKIGI
jgi:twitching motility protein PilT